MGSEKIYVLGAGLMGNGIAQVAAMTGHDVTMIDIKQEMIDKAYITIEKSLQRIVKKGDMKEEKAKEIRQRIKSTLNIADAKDADVVIEGVDEKLELKKSLFAKMDEICLSHTILMSNTSQFSITDIGSVTKRRDRVIGTHWFNPPPIMRLIEVVMGFDTSEETLQKTLDLCHRFGKETIVCRKDTKGFVITRALWAFRMECFRIMEEGIASVEDIDKGIKLAFNHPMGPFEMMDFGHLDLSLQVVTSLHETYGERFLPPQALINLVKSGYLGRRTGRGWYHYPEEKKH